ncbi:alkene reductase [Variovorax sp. LjRoot290]|uniref:oxidoreductase n=1 Tax=Variovorax sp. LjRoot290 TaxID=3342316 RepID=UPI003ED06A6E
MANLYTVKNPAQPGSLIKVPSSASLTPRLNTPLQIGPWALSHRVVMAPFSRLLASAPEGVPSPALQRHYAMRASKGGLIVSESIAVAPAAVAQHGTAGIFATDQVNAWKSVTDEVHRQGGYMVAQLWHGGRLASPRLTGLPAIGASAIALPATIHAPGAQRRSAEPPLVLDDDGIEEVIDQYRRAAENAADAGFDGVEMCCANGCLADQFLHSGSNVRTDRYGGPTENRVRFLIDAVQSLASVWGSSRVGVRLSPLGAINGTFDAAPELLFPHLLRRLHEESLAYVHVAEPRALGGFDHGAAAHEALVVDWLRPSYPGVIVASGGFDGASASAVIERGAADAVGFGRSFAANPDLPERLLTGGPLKVADPTRYFIADEADDSDDADDVDEEA